MKRKVYNKKSKKVTINPNLMISDCKELPDLREKCNQVVIIIDALLLDFIEVAYHNPSYKIELKEIYDGIAPTAAILRGTVAFIDREDNATRPTLNTIEEDKVYTPELV